MPNRFSAAKGVLQSRTVWGGALAIIAAGANMLGYAISPENQAGAVDAITSIAAGVGGIIAVVGRIRATKQITRVR